VLPHHLVPLPCHLLDCPLLLNNPLLLRLEQILEVPDPCLLFEHLSFKLGILHLFAFNEAFHVLNLSADLVEPLLVLDALLV
jgi:hypothetical protein